MLVAVRGPARRRPPLNAHPRGRAPPPFQGGPVIARCRTCLAPIDWARTAKGFRIPLDPADSPGPEPNLIVLGYDDVDGAPLVRGVTAEDAELHPGATLRRSHFATCPDAKKHRRRRP